MSYKLGEELRIVAQRIREYMKAIQIKFEQMKQEYIARSNPFNGNTNTNCDDNPLLKALKKLRVNNEDLKELATKKAIDLVKMAIAKARYIEPLDHRTNPVGPGASAHFSIGHSPARRPRL